MSLNPDTLRAPIPATFHPGAIRVAWVQRFMRDVVRASSFSFRVNDCTTESRLVAAQLPGLFDQRDERRRIDGKRARLGSPLFGDLVEIGLRFRQLGDKMPAQLRQIAA